MTVFHELAGLIADEERAAASALIRDRVECMAEQNDGPIRVRIFSVATLTAGAELYALLEGSAETANQLRRLADVFEASIGPKC